MVKKGFSLAETLVVMAVISIFFAAAAKVVTQKPKAKNVTPDHGYYECYYNGANLNQRYARGTTSGTGNKVSNCTFSPSGTATFFNIRTFAPKGDCVSPAYSLYEPQIVNNLTINIEKCSATSNGAVQISNSSGEMLLPLNSGDQDLEDMTNYIKNAYPNSNIVDSNGNARYGVLISW